jgi:large subunit ribosomal protein L13
MEKFPTRVVEIAVKGMLPKTKLGEAMYKKLFVYAGTEHKHEAQKPTELKIK